MHGLIVLLLVWLVRYLLGRRLPRTSSFISVARWILILRLVCGGWALLSAYAHQFAWAVTLLLFAFPQAIARLLLIPLGVPHVTYWFLRVSSLGWNRGEATFYELRARLRKGHCLQPHQRERLGAKLFQVAKGDQHVRGATLATSAMLSALEGRTEDARQLLAVVQEMRSAHAPRPIRSYAQSFLLCEAAQRGDYLELLRSASRGPRTFGRRFMCAAALRLVAHPLAPNDSTLRRLWLCAPARWHTRSLLDLALAVSPRAPLRPPDLCLAGARRGTVALMVLPRGSVLRQEVREVARAWQHAFDRKEVRQALEQSGEAASATFRVESAESRLESVSGGDARRFVGRHPARRARLAGRSVPAHRRKR